MEHAMTDTIQIADEAATRLAFGLMRSAYLDLARMLRSIEDEPARELLEAVENRLHYRLGTPVQDVSPELPRTKAIVTASQRVREVLREAVER